VAERAYRRALVKKHITMARILAEKGFAQEAVARERAIVALIYAQYRALLKEYQKGTV
jgi:hypothetical protein